MLKSLRNKLKGTFQRFKKKKETNENKPNDYVAIETPPTFVSDTDIKTFGFINSLIQVKPSKRSPKIIQIQKQRSQKKNWSKWKKRK